MKCFFKLTDIVVWKDIITAYGVIYDMLDFSDDDLDVRKATVFEVEHYYKYRYK